MERRKMDFLFYKTPVYAISIVQTLLYSLSMQLPPKSLLPPPLLLEWPAMAF
jgi:hypothetical protein